MNNSYNGTTKPQNQTSIPGFSLYMDHESYIWCCCISISSQYQGDISSLLHSGIY